MAHTYTVCAVTTHMPVEIGDTHYPARFPKGVLVELDEKAGSAPTERMCASVACGGGRLNTSAHALGLIWLHEDHVVARPHEGPVDHQPGWVKTVDATSEPRSAAA